MPTQEQKDRIVELAKQGVPYRQIAEQTGMKKSLVYYYMSQSKLRAKSGKPESGNALHSLTPNDTKNVQHLTSQGMSARQISEKLKLSVYNVYRAQKMGGVSSGLRNPESTFKLGEKIVQLKDGGMSYNQIAKKFHKPIGTIYRTASYYREHSNKGAVTIHGNATNHNGNGQFPINAPSKAELIGFAWAQVERGIADLAQRTTVSTDVLRRRISELLGYTAIR